jgi:hypothetical protein
MASRRTFLTHAGLASAGLVLLSSPELVSRGWLAAAKAAGPDLVTDTLNGLLAFVVPGADGYSLAQGISTQEAGGVEAGVAQALIETIDASAPYLPSFSAVVASILNDLAQAVGAPASGDFEAPFARLSFAQKVAVLQIMDSTDPLKPLAGVLPAIVAYLAHSEAGAFDPATRSITSPPVGWTISDYTGVAEGRAELRGYFRGRREAE